MVLLQSYGHGFPLVLIHGGGSTIQSTFEKVIPGLSQDHKVIAVELQAHGRTSDRAQKLTFEQDADDVARLLKNLQIEKADIFGFSNGATTTIQMAIRHPAMVNKIVLGSPLCKRSGVPDNFWNFMKQASLSNMPQELKDCYLAVSPDPDGLQIMHDKDANRMVHFKDIPDELIARIKSPTLIINGDHDLITAQHVIELQRLIDNAELAIIPGIHGEYIAEIATPANGSKKADFVVAMIEEFLDRSTTNH